MPELVTIELDPRLGAAEPDPEIQDLINASAGTNLGVDFLPGSLTYSPAGVWQPEPELAAEIVWLDALTTNVDRTARNPNLLVWHRRLWLIDHGAALYLQHAGLDPERHAAAAVPADRRPRAAAVRGVDHRGRRAAAGPARARGGHRRGRRWCPPTGSRPTSGRVYVDYLHRRLADGGFAREAEEARAGR